VDGSKSDFDRSPSRQEIAARSDAATAKVAVLWRGDHLAPRVTTLKNNRFSRTFEEFAALGVHVEPVVYADDIVGDVHEQLLKLDGVLVWVDPIFRKDRTERRSTRCCETWPPRAFGSAHIPT
jgi:hypothetical protein